MISSQLLPKIGEICALKRVEYYPNCLPTIFPIPSNSRHSVLQKIGIENLFSWSEFKLEYPSSCLEYQTLDENDDFFLKTFEDYYVSFTSKEIEIRGVKETQCSWI